LFTNFYNSASFIKLIQEVYLPLTLVRMTRSLFEIDFAFHFKRCSLTKVTVVEHMAHPLGQDVLDFRQTKYSRPCRKVETNVIRLNLTFCTECNDTLVP